MKKNYKLDILIPTYNRAKDLERNLKMLKDYIIKYNFLNIIRIIVSDNNSTDTTKEVVLELKKDKIFKELIKYSKQLQNIGLEKNALDVLSKSTAEYVMYLGDDDYLEDKYLEKVVYIINNETDIGLILPSFITISPNGISLNNGRDLKIKSKKYKKGFYNCLINSWRGHQLSGIVLKRENLLNKYKENNVSNIYPFIYFTSVNCMNYDTYHVTEFPVKVTQPGQENKDWNYRDDGLISEIFDNYKKIVGINLIERFLLEMKLLKEQNWRYLTYKFKSPIVVIKIIKNKNTSILTKLVFPVYFLTISFFKLLKKGIKNLCQQ